MTSSCEQRVRRLRERLAADLPRSVVCVRHGGETMLHESFGDEPVDAVFRLAALSRPIVAATALALVEEGRLALDDAVAGYLPAFAAVQVGREEGGHLVLEPLQRPMTVLDLLRHTSGLTYGMFGDSLVQRLYREARLMEPSQTNEEMADRLARLPLQCQPGAQFEYGMSTDLLGRVLEVAAGRSLGQLVLEHITGPLGLSMTGFHLAQGAVLAQASPSAVLFDYDRAHPPVWESGGAGLLSTAADYARFAQMLLDGGWGLLSPASVAAMLADHLPPGIAYGTSTSALGINAPVPANRQGYGLGVGVGARGDFFWGGALGPYFWADREQQLVAVLMLHENDPQRRARYRTLLRDAVYGALQ